MNENLLKNEKHDLQKESKDSQIGLLFASFEMRIFSILTGLILAYIIKKIIGFDVPPGAYKVFYIWLFTSVVYLAVIRMSFKKRLRILENIHFSYYFFGAAYATILVYQLGGAEWIAVFFYFFDLTYANVLLRRHRGTIVTFYIALCYVTMMLLERKGMIPHQHIFDEGMDPHGPVVFWTNITVLSSVFLLISYSTGLFAKMKEARENMLFESKTRFAAKSEKLEEINRELSKKIAENRYLRSTAMGYLQKKEFEISNTKKELENKIENLRKTQKSMFFMIEDLNEMSSQLKDSKDNLEEKVRERTDELLNISRKLHRSERLAFLGKLAGSVTHEVRNPLAVLKNAAYYLDKRFQGKKEDEKILKYVEIIKKEISIIDSIIDDIMGFARTKAPELAPTDLNSVVDNAIELVNVPELVEVIKEYDKLPKVEIDADQVMHAVMNITNNAIMAMNGNGALTIVIKKENENACVEIRDTGPGIPPDQRDLIFEPLYSSKPKGTGLGLPISKMMIENQEGTVEFESELGVGTIFRILIPLIRRKRKVNNE